jgi:hypothetical protein
MGNFWASATVEEIYWEALLAMLGQLSTEMLAAYTV